MSHGGKGYEDIWESRRVWGAGLALLATVLAVAVPNWVPVLVPVFSALAGLLGLVSWAWPK